MITTFVTRPSFALHGYINHYTLREIDTEGGELLKPIWAGDESCLTFWLKKTAIRYALPAGTETIDTRYRHMVGVQARYSGHLVLSGAYSFLGVEFKPGGFFSLFGVPMKHIRNTLHHMDDIMGQRLSSMEEQLQESGDLGNMKNILDHFFLSLLQKREQQATTQKIAAAYSMLKQQDFSDIPALAREVNMSLRSFEYHFEEQIGLSPMTTVRIRRFHKALQLKMRKPADSWTSIAHECGYFDQNHFIKDFKSFAGDSPRSFFKNLPPPAEQV
ncbi:MAG: AraC family transcriptional regulator, partial [Chitinophagaceae bacterium]|nr:AraC family transcriptional regulator [Chitinophagaceae bacterium]